MMKQKEFYLAYLISKFSSMYNKLEMLRALLVKKLTSMKVIIMI